MKPKALAFVLAAALAIAGGVLFLRPVASEAAPQELDITQTCTPDARLSARFNWNDNNPAIVQQWLDLSLSDNHWQPGTFLGNGPMPASQQSLTWVGLQQGARHFVRLNQWLPGATVGAAPDWESGATFYFDTGNCTPGATGVAGVILPSGGSGASLPAVESGRKRVLAPIDDAQVLPGSQPGTFVAQVKAGLPGGCAKQAGYTVDRQSGPTVTVITVTVYNTLPIANVVCTDIYGTYNVSADLGALTAGPTYEIHVNDKVVHFAIP